MKSFKNKLFGLGVLLFLLAVVGSVIAVKYYDYVFAKTVTGQVVGVERVNTNETIITSGSAIPASQIFSFAVAIKDSAGEIHTASSEDRQWAVVQKGQCGEALYYPYPPWDLNRARTYHNARLLRLFDCQKPEESSKDAPKPAPVSPAPSGQPAGP